MLATRLSGFVHCRGKSFDRVAPRLAPITESLSGCLGDKLVPPLARSCGPVVTMRQAVGAKRLPRSIRDSSRFPIPLAQRLPGRQLLRAHPPAVIQVAHVAVQERVLARPQEPHPQDLLPTEMWAEWVGRTDEPDPGDLIDPHVHHPFRRVVAEFDLPPPQVGRSLEHRCGRAGQVRRGEAVAEDEDQRPGRRQVRDQTFYLAGGLAAICGLSAALLILYSSPAAVPLVVGNTAPRKIDTRRPSRCHLWVSRLDHLIRSQWRRGR
jgi:hypothetical protein